ncbi:MAG: hypothetical protein HYS12_13430 [Planctomycetes bacterium]|nr:hypothetical protein [Planctomycetota bacterium]
MAEEAGGRREKLIIEAFDPPDGVCEVQLSYARLQTVAKRSQGHAKECCFIVPFILQNPTAVFEGLMRDEDEDRQTVGWRCYCGIPKCSYNRDGVEGRAYSRQVYLVFVNDERVAYNWRWEEADEEDRTLPANHQTRFKRRLY